MDRSSFTQGCRSRLHPRCGIESCSRLQGSMQMPGDPATPTCTSIHNRESNTVPAGQDITPARRLTFSCHHCLHPSGFATNNSSHISLTVSSELPPQFLGPAPAPRCPGTSALRKSKIVSVSRGSSSDEPAISAPLETFARTPIPSRLTNASEFFRGRC